MRAWWLLSAHPLFLSRTGNAANNVLAPLIRCCNGRRASVLQVTGGGDMEFQFGGEFT